MMPRSRLADGAHACVPKAPPEGAESRWRYVSTMSCTRLLISPPCWQAYQWPVHCARLAQNAAGTTGITLPGNCCALPTVLVGISPSLPLPAGCIFTVSLDRQLCFYTAQRYYRPTIHHE